MMFVVTMMMFASCGGGAKKAETKQSEGTEIGLPVGLQYLLRKITRPVSYYALFECVAASKPTSWLFSQFHIVFHLAYIWDLSCGSGLFPSRQ